MLGGNPCILFAFYFLPKLNSNLIPNKYEGCSKSIRPLAGKNTFTRLEVCNPNPLQSSLLVTEHNFPGGSAIIRSISGMHLCE
jgi:hypothetical protein